MKCPACSSEEVRRSLRKGLREGLLLRLIWRAPFHCFHCGTSFIGYSGGKDFRKLKRHHSVDAWLGLRGQEQKLRRITLIVALATCLIIVGIMLALYLTVPGAPVVSP